MVYEIHIPTHPLISFISHFTYFKNYSPQHSIDRFLPNGNTEIVIDLTSETKFIYDNISLQEIQSCKKIWVSGIRNEFITIPSGKNSEMFIINFKKGMAYPFLQTPLYTITDTVVDGDQLLSPIFLDLRNILLECSNPASMFEKAERLITKGFLAQLQVNRFIEFSVSSIVQSPESTTMDKLSRQCGYSSKHLIHLFKKHVGVSPKNFLKIIRFQKVIAEIEHNQFINWPSLAVECGYYDQSHFIADFKTFSGFTPTEYMLLKNDQLNYVPVQY